MSTKASSRPVVLVVEAEPIFQNLREGLGKATVEVVLAPHPAQARIIAGSRRPALVVMPTPQGHVLQAKSLRAILPPATRILGLVADTDGLEPPEGVDRVVRLKDKAGVQAAAEILLEEAAAGPPRASASKVGAVNEGFDDVVKGGPRGASAAAPKVAEEAAAEEAPEDVDPSRAAAIRELGLAIRMQKAVSGARDVPLPPVVGLSLSSVDRDDPSRIDIGVGSTKDALSSLPDPSAAVSPEEYRAKVVATREADAISARDRQAAAEALALIRSQGPPRRDETRQLELAVVARNRRRRLITLIVVGLVLAAAGTAGTWLYLRYRAAEKARAARKPPPEELDETLISRAAAAAKRGVLVDPFAGAIARAPGGVRATDVDVGDEQLNRSVPELDRWFELALRRLSARKAREQLMGRAEPLVKYEDYGKARYYLERAMKIRDGVDVRELLATVYERTGRLAEARHQLRKALNLARRRVDLRVRVAQLYLKEGKTKEGCAELKLVLRKAKDQRALYTEKCEGKGGTP